MTSTLNKAIVALCLFSSGFLLGWQWTKWTSNSLRIAEERPFRLDDLTEGSINSGLRSASTVSQTLAIENRLREALENIDPQRRTDSLVDLAKTLAAENPREAWHWQSRISAFDDREVYCLALLTDWASQFPKEALSAVESLAPSALRSSCVACVLGQWALVSPIEAVDYAERRLVGAARHQGLESAVRSWTAKDAASAIEWSLSHLDQENGVVLEAALETWTEMSPHEAAMWVAQLPEEPLRKRAAEVIVGRWAEQYPQEAGEWIGQHDSELALTQEAAAVAASWAELDPRSAAEWALRLDRTSTRREAISHAVATWSSADPQSVAEWLGEHSHRFGEVESAAYRSLAAVWSSQTPHAAANWLTSLADQQLAIDIAPTLFNTWAATDPESMTHWVKAHVDVQLATLAHAELDRIVPQPAETFHY